MMRICYRFLIIFPLFILSVLIFISIHLFALYLVYLPFPRLSAYCIHVICSTI